MCNNLTDIKLSPIKNVQSLENLLKNHESAILPLTSIVLWEFATKNLIAIQRPHPSPLH